MSLVSYGASDESDSDDEKVTTNVQIRGKIADPALSGHISDEDDFNPAVDSTSVTSTSGMGLMTVIDKATLQNNNTDNSVNSTSVISLDDLPVPHSLTYSSEFVEEELEEEVRPKASEIISAPKPPSKKSKQPVKITIPSLDETADKEGKDSVRKAAPSEAKSGLFSLLPAPVHAAKKEANRPLIPHTLTKKTVPASASKISSTGNKQPSSGSSKSSNASEVASTTTEVSSKRLSQFNALTGYDSDSDEEYDTGITTNFFSLVPPSEGKAGNSTSESTAKRLQSQEVSSSETELSSSETELKHGDAADQHEASSENDDKEDVEEEKEEDIGPEPGAVNDAPLDFRSVNRLSAWSGSSYGFLGPVGLTGPVLQPRTYTAAYHSSSSLPSSSVYNLANTEVPKEFSDEDNEAVSDEDLKKFMSDKEFQKLQGKRKRGHEETISFVDANVDDYVDPSEVSKHLTEETDYVSHKSKDNLPTAQQRRKKQITYLAYQAKERELELKNTWAQNRMTKRQTQSKYGF